MMPGEIKIRHCDTLAEYRECVQLELSTWGETITVPSAIFTVAHHTGGQILGAFDGATLVGFTLALAGMRDGKAFLHSHMTAVLPEYQNRGIGRRLKLFQREDALRRGISLIEWTFDPLELKNAHFNLVRLGAIARRYIEDCYGLTESPVHAGLPTDRLVAEWWLDSDRVRSILEGKPLPLNSARHIGYPSNIGEIKTKNRAAGARYQAEAREKFLQMFSRGFVATYIETRDSTTDYVLEPAASLAGLELLPSSAHGEASE
ncbi:MAG: GNAT family N-acetyltransferase [Candidatus Acidiferrales bacterium]